MEIDNEKQVVTLTVDELKTEMQNVANAAAQEVYKQGELSKIRAPQFFKGLSILPENTMKKWERTVKYFKALNQHDIAGINQLVRDSYANAENPFYKAAGGLSEGVNADGGFLVPVEFTDQLIMTLETYGVARRFSTVVPMLHLTKNLNALTSKVAVGWTAEGGAITPSKWGIGRPVLTANKLAGITMWTSELLEDTIVSIIDNLIILFAEAFYGEEDNQYFNGTGSPFTGILQVGGTKDTPVLANNLGSSASISYDNMMDCTKSLSPGALGQSMGQLGTGLGNATWFMHRTVFALCREIKDSVGRPITSDGTALTPATLLGYPVVENEKMPAAGTVVASQRFAIFGNPKPWVYFGDRRNITTKILDQATIGSDNLGQQDEQALRVIERVAEVVAIPANIATLITTA